MAYLVKRNTKLYQQKASFRRK